MAEKIVQTAGRNQLGEFAPMFAHLNDDVLFGEVWNDETIDRKTRCIITVVSLMASGITDSSLTYHLQNAENNGVTREEIAAVFAMTRQVCGQRMCRIFIGGTEVRSTSLIRLCWMRFPV